MKQNLYSICFAVLLSFNSFAGIPQIDVQYLYRQIGATYTNLTAVMVKANMKLFNGPQSQSLMQEVNAVYKIKGDAVFYDLGEVVVLSNSKLQLCISHEDALIEIFQPQQINPFAMLGLDTLMDSTWLKVQLDEDEKDYIITGTRPETDNRKSVLFINKKTFLVEKLVLYTSVYDYNDDFDQEPESLDVRLEINYTINTKPKFDESDFSELQFVDWKDAMHVNAVKDYKGYKIINHLN